MSFTSILLNQIILSLVVRLLMGFLLFMSLYAITNLCFDLD